MPSTPPVGPAFLSRRALLRALAIATTAAPLTALAATDAIAIDAYDTLRTTWRDLTLGSGFDPGTEPYRSKLAALGTTAATLRATMAPSAGSLWPELPYTDTDPDTDTEPYTYSGNLAVSYQRLRTLTEAYTQPGTGLTRNTSLLTEILAGLDRLHADAYHAGQARYGNWHNWQIGIPQALLDICVYLYSDLGATRISDHIAAIDHFVPDSAVADYTGTSTGANRVDLDLLVQRLADPARPGNRLTSLPELHVRTSSA
jgi:hyaluronate lyase